MTIARMGRKDTGTYPGWPGFSPARGSARRAVDVPGNRASTGGLDDVSSGGVGGGEERGGDPGHAGRARHAGWPALHAGDAAVLRSALPGEVACGPHGGGEAGGATHAG